LLSRFLWLGGAICISSSVAPRTASARRSNPASHAGSGSTRLAEQSQRLVYCTSFAVSTGLLLMIRADTDIECAPSDHTLSLMRRPDCSPISSACRSERMPRRSALDRVILGAITAWSPVMARSYVYDAVCEDSYLKQGEVRYFRFTEKTSSISPLRFPGAGLDHDQNPNFVTLPLDRIYLPHVTCVEGTQAISGIEGFCFFDGKMNIRALSGANRSATAAASLAESLERECHDSQLSARRLWWRPDRR